MKTSELTGTALDWAVAQCLGLEVTFDSWGVCYIGKVQRDESGLGYPAPFEPSHNWAQGGPIIEREKLWIGYSASGTTLKLVVMEDAVVQCHKVASPVCSTTGPTVLIAAMRCYVVSKLGDTVEIPEELK